MLLICTGYLPSEAGLTGVGWDKNVRALAQERGILTELDQVDLAAPLTRDNAAQLVNNALEATMVTYDYILMQVNGELTSKPTLREGKPSDTLLGVYFPNTP